MARNDPEQQDKKGMASRVRRGIERIYLRQLRKILMVLFGYYSFVTLSHFFVIAEDIRLQLMIGSSLAAIGSGALYVLIRMRKIRFPHGHLAYVPVALLTITAIYSHIFLTGDQLQLTNGILALFAFAFTTLSVGVYFGIMVVCSLLYMAVLVLVPGPDTVHFVFMYIAGATLSVLGFWLRYRTVYNSQVLLISNRRKASKLVEAQKRIQENIGEVHRAVAEAKRANAAKDVFLANTTHELRTPLTGVLGMMDLLSETRLDADQQQAVDAAQFSAKTLLVVVNDLLDIAKLDAGKMELASQAFSPSDVVAHVVGLLHAKAEAKSLTVTVVGVKPPTVSLVGDPVRIGQIVLNLLDNAIKFSPEGEIVVTLKVAEDKPDQNNAALNISIRDNGPGIDPQDQKRLFDRFEQLDSTASRHAEGAGLGLSISQQLATRMGGRVSVESEDGEGATFSFDVVLPLAKLTDTAVEAIKPIIVEVSEDAGTEDGLNSIAPPTPHILLAEDNVVNQLLVKKIAAKFGWALTIASNGEEAVQYVADGGAFDVILMDIRMPVMDGVTATKTIKSMEPDKARTPIIALTANTGDKNEAEYREHGIASVVGKPIDATFLKAAVEQLLKDAAVQ